MQLRVSSCIHFKKALSNYTKPAFFVFERPGVNGGNKLQSWRSARHTRTTGAFPEINTAFGPLLGDQSDRVFIDDNHLGTSPIPPPCTGGMQPAGWVGSGRRDGPLPLGRMLSLALPLQ
jgi:hypothetical protein